MQTTHLAILSFAFAFGCFEPADPDDDTGSSDGGAIGSDGGTADGGGLDDTGVSDIAFEVVRESYTSQACGPTPAESVQCTRPYLETLTATSSEELAALFAGHNVNATVPEVSFDGRIAVLSYLPLCQSFDFRLRIDRVHLEGETLWIDELLEQPDWAGMATGCIYSVHTIPDTDFTEVFTTLTNYYPK